MRTFLAVLVCSLGGLASSATVTAQSSSAPRGIELEQTLPSRYEYVVQDILRLCEPQRGCWVDLGAGKGQVTLPLIEATGHPVLMIDPDSDAMTQGLERAREKHLADRLFAVVGTAEALPLPDNSVDLLVSRGSIFFWSDPGRGLREVLRVLRPGGKAYIGGGAGSGFPREAAARLIENRRAQLQGDDAATWQRFVDLRSPDQMRKWAEAAGLPAFEVLGQGAISAEDDRVGQGVWLLFTKALHSAQ